MRERFLAVLGIAAGTGLLAVGLVTAPVVAAQATPPWVAALEAEYGYESWLKIDLEVEEGDFANGVTDPDPFTVGHADVDAFGPMPEDLEIILSDFWLDEAAKVVHFTWTATAGGEPHLVYVVLVKAGPGANEFTYPEGASTGDVYAPMPSLSNVIFGWGEQEAPPTTPTTPTVPPVTVPPVTVPPVTVPPVTVPPETVPFDLEPTVPPTVLPTTEVPATEAPTTEVVPATEAPTTTEEVLGAVVERELPRTGAASTALAQIGLGLLLVGAGLLAHSRRVAYGER